MRASVRGFDRPRWPSLRLLAVLTLGALAGACPASAQSPTAKIAAAMSLSGPGEFAGRPLIDAVRLAVEEANAEGRVPKIEVETFDDRSTPDGAREAARRVGGSDAMVVVGPTSALAVAACPIYAEAGIVSIVGTVHSDAVTGNATTFRPVFSTSEMGDASANYLAHILGNKRAVVLYRDDDYGRPFADGFRRAAERLDIAASYHAFATPEQRTDAARLAAADAAEPAVVLGMTFGDAVPVLITLRRQHTLGPILGTATMARASFSELFRDQPEYRENPGFFTDGVYALSPAILDSANALTLGFAERYRARYGREPSWEAIQSYDSTRLAIAAIRAAFDDPAANDLTTRRAAVKSFLGRLDGPAHAVEGLTGPLWFTPDHGRQQAVGVGRFHGALFESVPLQLVPAPTADAAEIASGALIDIGSGHFARRQQVIYTGIFLNEIARVDIAQSRFSADFYLWIRFARDAGAGAADPADIDFPDLVRGTSDGKVLAAQRDLDDGTTYRLWHMRGDFKNDFDLHRYPADHQTLGVRFFNAHAATDRVVYVQDRRASESAAGVAAIAASATDSGSALASTQRAASGRGSDPFATMEASNALRNLTQWEAVRTSQSRDSLVTQSALGDPDLVGLDRVRELSGFGLSVEVRRRVMATLVKSLLPLGLMALIMYAALYFPPALVKEKVTVAVTGVLSGAVLLSAINAQLGNIGYIIAIEYGFYLFFALALLSVVAVLVAERYRAAGHPLTAAIVDRSSRYVFLFLLAAGIAAAGAAIPRIQP